MAWWDYTTSASSLVECSMLSSRQRLNFSYAIAAELFFCFLYEILIHVIFISLTFRFVYTKCRLKADRNVTQFSANIITISKIFRRQKWLEFDEIRRLWRFHIAGNCFKVRNFAWPERTPRKKKRRRENRGYRNCFGLMLIYMMGREALSSRRKTFDCSRAAFIHICSFVRCKILILNIICASTCAFESIPLCSLSSRLSRAHFKMDFFIFSVWMRTF